MKDINLHYNQKERAHLIELYGEEKVEWAEKFLEENADELQDDRDRNYP